MLPRYTSIRLPVYPPRGIRHGRYGPSPWAWVSAWALMAQVIRWAADSVEERQELGLFRMDTNS
jgi:hypothetical protein